MSDEPDSEAEATRALTAPPAPPEEPKGVAPYALQDEETFAGEREDLRRIGWSPRPAKGRDLRRLGAAASLAAVLAIGIVAAAAHVRGLSAAKAERAETGALAHRLDAMSARLESLESNRSRDELANMRKVLAEIKAGAAGTRDVNAAVAQLGGRVDRLEKDQGARLDKLGDRIDHDAAARLGDVSARLEKIEKANAAAVAAAAAKPAPAPPVKAEAAKPAPVANDMTGAIRPRVRLRGYALSEIHNGYAMIDSPNGEFAVAPGDMVPGGGRVLRIERQGREWVVVTTQGQIQAMRE